MVYHVICFIVSSTPLLYLVFFFLILTLNLSVENEDLLKCILNGSLRREFLRGRTVGTE